MTARTACVDVPALPLQLLVQEHPEWRSRPAAVVAEDRPQGMVLWVNDRAYRARVLPGMRYAAGLALCRELCAGTVARDVIDAGITRLTEILRGFSPEVEPSDAEPGVFWIDASGLLPLERSLEQWAARLHETLSREGFAARVAVGFSRFGAYALARTAPQVRVMESPEQERLASQRVRLDRMHLDPGLRDHLARLGIHTVGDFLRLPAGELGKRFGPDALRLHRLASGSLPAPLDPQRVAEPLEAWIELEHPEADAIRLTFVIKSALDPLLERLAVRHQGLAELSFTLLLDDRSRQTESVGTAEPTLEAPWVLDLVRLKLETLELSAGVVEIHLEARGAPARRDQLELFAERPRRDLSAASRAFARVRAEFGRLAVVWARLRHAHLPEAGFSWEVLEQARLPSPRRVAQRALVRRIFDRPVPLPHRGQQEPDGWLIRGPEQGPTVRIHGPYPIAGGWWAREVRRDYHFVETQKGDVMWVYYDRRRRRWFLQGQVE